MTLTEPEKAQPTPLCEGSQAGANAFSNFVARFNATSEESPRDHKNEKVHTTTDEATIYLLRDSDPDDIMPDQCIYEIYPPGQKLDGSGIIVIFERAGNSRITLPHLFITDRNGDRVDGLKNYPVLLLTEEGQKAIDDWIGSMFEPGGVYSPPPITLHQQQ